MIAAEINHRDMVENMNHKKSRTSLTVNITFSYLTITFPIRRKAFVLPGTQRSVIYCIYDYSY